MDRRFEIVTTADVQERRATIRGSHGVPPDGIMTHHQTNR